MDPKHISIEIPSEENPDWGYARSRRALLRTPNSEFSISAYSAAVGEFTIPNRDYPYEGLFAILGGENWKFLDGIAFCLKVAGKTAILRPGKVRIHPWKIRYSYLVEGMPEFQNAILHAEYCLQRDAPLPSLNVTFKLENMHSHDVVLRIRPFADIRHMYGPSLPEKHKVKELADGICIEKDDRQLYISSKNFSSFAEDRHVQPWHYKLGSGSREYIGGALRFIPDVRDVFIPGALDLTLSKSLASVQLTCAFQCKKKPAVELVSHNEKKLVAKIKRTQKLFASQLRLADALPKNQQLALHGRLLALIDSFDFASDTLTAPDAGAFWFRNIWFRDAFQGMYDNFDLFFKAKKAYLKSLLLQSLKLQRGGLIPNKLPEKREEGADYSSMDATLLCFLCCLKYLKYSDDKTLSSAVKEGVKAFLHSLTGTSAELENYLLKTPPHYSWMDSKTAAIYRGEPISVSTRLPAEWVKSIESDAKAVGEFLEKANGPHYYLVELNALWIRFLADFNALYPSKEFETLQTAASLNFKSFFFTDAPSATMNEKFEKASELSSASICAASLLPELFSDDEIQKLIRTFEPSLAYRERKLFGILVRNLPNRIFLGDSEYHGAVIWPRDSVPLLKLLSRIRDPRTLEILESNLEHQMDEGAVFYNHELFALPEGQNPHPSSNSYSPIPVRNPAQFWSQWVQPYFDYLSKQ
ncbi:MAG TPA: amylo-alpha-1,6-glucosidase [Candidatus Norongarragalinales archaeon]|nr:amylo-alpha-1,6-glucosidase [Candidatus Norongarragalinales archaeon]